MKTQERQIVKTLSEAAAESQKPIPISGSMTSWTWLQARRRKAMSSRQMSSSISSTTRQKNWVERGRGGIRLNDDPSSTPGHLRSRLVMRSLVAQGDSQHKLFPNMICEKAMRKCAHICDGRKMCCECFSSPGLPKDADKITALEYDQTTDQRRKRQRRGYK